MANVKNLFFYHEHFYQSFRPRIKLLTSGYLPHLLGSDFQLELGHRFMSGVCGLLQVITSVHFIIILLKFNCKYNLIYYLIGQPFRRHLNDKELRCRKGTNDCIEKSEIFFQDFLKSNLKTLQMCGRSVANAASWNSLQFWAKTLPNIIKR